MCVYVCSHLQTIDILCSGVCMWFVRMCLCCVCVCVCVCVVRIMCVDGGGDVQ